MGEDFNHFRVHKRAFTVFGANELRKGSMTRPSMLNADSKVTIVNRIVKTFPVTLERTGNFAEFTFYYIKISKVSLSISISSTKYYFISVRHYIKFLDARNEWKSLKALSYFD
jgi:hypothetical protein